MTEPDIKYYILFENYTHGMALHELMLADGIPHRIAPAPRSVQGELPCGMSLLVAPEHIEAAKACIDRCAASRHRAAGRADKVPSGSVLLKQDSKSL